MKPYTRRGLTKEETICNYRISRGRRVVENAFGILSSRFRCLLTTLQQNPDNCRIIVEACVCLHNIIRMRYPALQNADMDMEDSEHNPTPGEWRNSGEMHWCKTWPTTWVATETTLKGRKSGITWRTTSTALLVLFHGKRRWCQPSIESPEFDGYYCITLPLNFWVWWLCIVKL